ncbi:hypothetical protein CGC20_8435 [Leishmania donovani]|uniref:Uncharacterized protein n=1 Tax=Leishmania donovani TaxID=5661 RepID=A0A504X229_LEIDO|nr:hypothetical protein CGC21_18465 [Leishmania donovani]TPP42922.1 hypothetical protein CGC20_8435 [Leishmania donovani]
MHRCRRTFTAAAAAATSLSASSSTSADGRPLVADAEAMERSGAAAMHSLYRRLLKAGEEGRMMQHCLTVNSLSDSLTYGLRLLRLHRELTTVDATAQQTPWWRERYRTLSIPIIQTLDALEAAQARKRELRKEMEKDIVQGR